MKTKKTEILLSIFIYILLITYIYYLFKNSIFFREFNELVTFIYISLSVVVIYYFFYRIIHNFNKGIYIFCLICYLIILVLSLFYRKTNDSYILANPYYIKKWIYIIFTNKIVFLNIIGNILLFIPLGYFINELKLNLIIELLICLVIIILLELIQYISKKGIFDYIDIVLNYIGIIVGICLCIRKEN